MYMLMTTRKTTTRYETRKGTAICGLPHSFDMSSWSRLRDDFGMVQSLSFVSPARTLFHPADVAIWNSSRNAFGTLREHERGNEPHALPEPEHLTKNILTFRS